MTQVNEKCGTIRNIVDQQDEPPRNLADFGLPLLATADHCAETHSSLLLSPYSSLKQVAAQLHGEKERGSFKFPIGNSVKWRYLNLSYYRGLNL